MLFALKLVAVPEETPTELLGRILKLKKMPSTLGRGKDATVIVRHRKLSRLHCRFYMSEDQLHVRDLGSTNGTIVNGHRVEGPQVLQLGDHISLGGVVFQVGQLVVPHTASTAPVSTAPVSPAPVSPAPELVDPVAGAPVSTTAAAAPVWVAPSADPSRDWAGIHPAAGGAAQPLSANTAVGLGQRIPDSETVDWCPGPPHSALSSSPPAGPVSKATGASAEQTLAPAVAAEAPPISEQIELDLEAGRVVDPTASDTGLSAAEFVLQGVPIVAPVSSVQIDSSFVAKVGTADPAALAELSEEPRPAIDPAEVDLGEIAERAKTASMTALGEFMQRQDHRKN
jgi:pSer/pThr/pTyr-binding forkhead associated (FHA) protein